MVQLPRMPRWFHLLVVAVCFSGIAYGQDAVPVSPRGLGAELTVEAMAGAADTVVIGECVGLQSVWSTPRHLVTLARISVTEVLKGEAGAEITVVLPGGVDLNRKVPVGMSYPGAPQIGSGEKVFLFLDSGSDVEGGQSVVGFSQGKFSVVTDDAGEQFVSRDRIEKADVKTSNGQPRGTRQLTPMSEFKSKVRAGLN